VRTYLKKKKKKKKKKPKRASGEDKGIGPEFKP
jgi:hypothetical protein